MQPFILGNCNVKIMRKKTLMEESACTYITSRIAGFFSILGAESNDSLL